MRVSVSEYAAISFLAMAWATGESLDDVTNSMNFRSRCLKASLSGADVVENILPTTPARITHLVETIATCLGPVSRNISVAMTDKAEPRLRQLPLELRRRIYALILPHRVLIDLRYAPIEMYPGKRDMIYRPKSEKPYQRGSQEEYLFE